MTNLQLLPMRRTSATVTNAQIVTLDRTSDEGITLRFLSKLDRGYGRREIKLDAETADQLLTMLSRELDGDMVMEMYPS